jgi:CheY-like chemotaxis protein
VNKSIVLIDDDLDEAELFFDALCEIKGRHDFRAFSDGVEALEHILTQRNYPNFVFQDLNMPLLSGREVLKKIRSHKDTRNISIVIYSNSISPADIEDTRQLNVSHYLQKPENFDSLCRDLRHILA